MSEFIGISENRMRYIAAVANKCYQLAKNEHLSEDECRAAFMCGYLHDVGYAFSEIPEEHPQMSLKLVELFQNYAPTVIADHGRLDAPQTGLLRILNTADLTVNSRGVDVSVEERLADIERRYTKENNGYKTVYLLAQKLNLLPSV